MSVNILTYMLAASLIQGGMKLEAGSDDNFSRQRHRPGSDAAELAPGAVRCTFPVLARASFGVLGANVAAVCVRWWPADGSAFRPGSAAKRSAHW